MIDLEVSEKAHLTLYSGLFSSPENNMFNIIKIYFVLFFFFAVKGIIISYFYH